LLEAIGGQVAHMVALAFHGRELISLSAGVNDVDEA
jgi:hypothetical protein